VRRLEHPQAAKSR
jgi:ribosome maturation protein SDO1